MSILLSIVAFILLLTLLIIIHELGHFTLAKLFKVEVEEFGFGLPPRALSLFTKGGTIFSLNWVPFGGFVRLKGENAVDAELRFGKGSFASAPAFARILILSGGVAMNFVLAFALFTFGFSFGRWVPYHYVTQQQFDGAVERGEMSYRAGVFIKDVVQGGAADTAKVAKGSEILAINGERVEKPQDVVDVQAGKTAVTYALRDTKTGQDRTVALTLVDGKSGIVLADSIVEAKHRSLGRSFALSAREMHFMTVQTLSGMRNLFATLLTRFRVPEGITGIVGIYGLTSSAVQEGFMTYLQLVALLSLSLAILNILPLPALDGGRLLFVLVEMVIRRPLNQQFEVIINAAGFFLLISLIVIITFNDVLRLF